jgi:hypothetical protein
VHKCILATRCSFFSDYVNIGIVFDYTHLGGVVRHKRSSPLSSLMDDFSDHVNAPAAKLRWLSNVKRILPSETPDTLSMQDGDCLYVVKEQPADDQLVELVKDAKKKMKLLRQADGTTLDSAQYVSVVNMDEDDPDAVNNMLHYLYTQQIPSAQWFGYTSLEADAKHYLLTIGLADKYDLSLFASMARKELEARIKDSDGAVLPLIVQAMHLENASKSVVAMRDFVIGEATMFFCKGGQFKDVMEAMVIEFPKFGFEVLSYVAKGAMDKIQKAEEGEMEGQDGDEEDEDGEPIQQVKPKRYSTRTKATPKKGRGGRKPRW